MSDVAVVFFMAYCGLIGLLVWLGVDIGLASGAGVLVAVLALIAIAAIRVIRRRS